MHAGHIVVDSIVTDRRRVTEARSDRTADFGDADERGFDCLHWADVSYNGRVDLEIDMHQYIAQLQGSKLTLVC